MNKKENEKDTTVYINEDLDAEGLGGKLKRLRKKLKECQKEKEGYLNQAQRAGADLINYRRRQEGALEEIVKRASDGLIRELLPVLDSLEMGARENEGVGLIKEQLEAVLGKRGVKAIEAVGEKFNPELHEAIEQVESEEESGIVVEEVQKGYFLGEKVLRVSRVKVGK
ncbi:nucleotide exchange factor GrpE [Patescibacteria group bacterium]|nr:nucleotide exchange factor GrpE [Patescibacteria group bacterium]MBU2579921.1 nucleotide exchange factor GrpE [Patescibacteria group bacterium]MBU4030550.1 nucleotide exchange factor GrpE [Patescibacteria group bacterium]